MLASPSTLVSSNACETEMRQLTLAVLAVAMLAVLAVLAEAMFAALAATAKTVFLAVAAVSMLAV